MTSYYDDEPYGPQGPARMTGDRHPPDDSVPYQSSGFDGDGDHRPGAYQPDGSQPDDYYPPGYADQVYDTPDRGGAGFERAGYGDAYGGPGRPDADYQSASRDGYPAAGGYDSGGFAGPDDDQGGYGHPYDDGTGYRPGYDVPEDRGYPAADDYQDQDGYANGTGAGTAYGTAKVSGSAQVRPSMPDQEFDPFAPEQPAPPAASGRASVGRATVPQPGGADNGYGFDDGFDPFADEPPAGRPTGRASVGRASVITPETPVVPGGPGGPDGPEGPDGPAGTGPKGRPAGKSKKPINKKARRRRRILATLAIMIMFTGIGVIAVVYYSSTIPLPSDLPPAQSTTLYYSDKTVMAQIGDTNRTLIPADQIKPNVREAVIATEDVSFYSNIGVDFKGIFRAFVNNITGGQTEGASTITQQYARAVDNLDTAPSYSRKLKEIVLAIKMTQKYSKDDILTNYLNIVYFGRGAYGIEAAAKAYFNKHAADLTTAEAMVLAGLIKDPSDNIYDPNCGTNHQPCATALARFNYIKAQMPKVPVRPGFLTPQEISALTYPTDWVPPRDNAAIAAMTTPLGYIVHHVMDELSTAKDAKGALIFPQSGPNSLLNGGYQIYTTIDRTTEDAAIAAAGAVLPNGKPDKTSPMYGLKKGIGGSVVAVQPGTGRVLAYYGGANGSGLDFGGIYDDPVLTDNGITDQHETPGSSFKTITMAAALKQGISINSYWYGPPVRDFHDGRAPITNSRVGGVVEHCPGIGDVCTMWKALQLSLNTVYYSIGTDTKEGMSPGKVIDMAYNLGVKQIWSDVRCKGQREVLTGTNGSQLASTCIGAEVSFGQFAVTVQDMANVMATFANHGVRATEHFVDKVTAGFGDDQTVYYDGNAQNKLTPSGLSPEQVDDETWAMQQVYTNNDEQDNQLANGRPAAVKTGTWQLGDTGKEQSEDGSAFFNGFTANNPAKPDQTGQGQIAASAWVGYTGDPIAVVDQNGKAVGGASLPAAIWQRVVDAYENHGPGGKPWPIYKFAPAAGTGDKNAGETEPPPAPPTVGPTGQPTGQPCIVPGGCGGIPPSTPPPSTPNPSPSTGTGTASPSPSRGHGGGGGGGGGGGPGGH